MRDFGNRLREERERLHLSQSEFASACEIGKTAQYMYEKGERAPSLPYLQKARETGADVLYILTGERSGNDRAYANAQIALLYHIELILGLKKDVLKYLICQRVELQEEEKIENLIKNKKIDDSPWIKNVMEWLLTATSPDNCVDFDMFTKILIEIENYIDSNQINLSADKKIKALLMLYRVFKTSGKIDETVIEETIKLASS